MFIELHRGPLTSPTPVTINTARLVEFSPSGTGTNIITTEDKYFVLEKYENVREALMPGRRKPDNTAEKLRQREEFFKGK